MKNLPPSGDGAVFEDVFCPLNENALLEKNAVSFSGRGKKKLVSEGSAYTKRREIGRKATMRVDPGPHMMILKSDEALGFGAF